MIFQSGDGARKERICFSLNQTTSGEGLESINRTAAADSAVILTRLDKDCQPLRDHKASDVDSTREKRSSEMNLNFVGEWCKKYFIFNN